MFRHTMPVPSPVPGLAAGGDLTSAVAFVDGPAAFLSPPAGDLGDSLAWRRFVRTIGDMQRQLGVEPGFVVADLHPDYASARHAAGLARAAGVPLTRVQHHHAHLASLLAEHGRSDRILALACDGVGYGEDGSAWGGEVLAGDLLGFERRAFLRPLLLPGGDAAALQIGRCGLAWLFDVLGPGAADHPAAARAEPDPERRRTILAMLAAGLRCPPSHGAGRLFDAAASLLGTARRNSFQAEAGISLEAAAAGARRCPDGTGVVSIRGQEIDPRPLLPSMLAIREQEGPGEAAWFFHDALADGLARAVLSSRGTGGPDTVGLTGGVFLNALLTERTAARLFAGGLAVLLHREVPPGDGGLALGQAAVAAARLAAGRW